MVSTPVTPSNHFTPPRASTSSNQDRSSGSGLDDSLEDEDDDHDEDGDDEDDEKDDKEEGRVSVGWRWRMVADTRAWERWGRTKAEFFSSPPSSAAAW